MSKLFCSIINELLFAMVAFFSVVFWVVTWPSKIFKGKKQICPEYPDDGDDDEFNN